jgi:phosphatidylinositol alpha 1,6-mannosyltransferase
MKVVYFTESLYPHVDGVSRTLARLFATLEREGVDFRIFAPFEPWPAVSWRDRVSQVGYVRFPLYPDYRISLPFSARVWRQLTSDPPDLIHLVSPTPLAYRAQRLARRFGVPVVASFHTHFVSYFRHYGVRRLENLGWRLLRRFYAGCARVYAPSASIERELRFHDIGPVELWSRGVDLERFSPAHRDASVRASVAGGGDAPILLLVSRLVREKDLADLVGVERFLRSHGVAFRLVLVGEGPMRDELRKELPNAHFTGQQSGADLSIWFASADVFVFPSTTETLGNVVLEALASGLPAVVVDRGGPQDLVSHGENGFVARANDITSIGEYVRLLLEDEQLRRRMSAQARDSAACRDWESINRGLLDSYARVIGEHRSNQLDGRR